MVRIYCILYGSNLRLMNFTVVPLLGTYLLNILQLCNQFDLWEFFFSSLHKGKNWVGGDKYMYKSNVLSHNKFYEPHPILVTIKSVVILNLILSWMAKLWCPFFLIWCLFFITFSQMVFISILGLLMSLMSVLM